MSTRVNWATDPAATGSGLWEAVRGGGTVTSSFPEGVVSPPPGTNLSTVFRVQPDTDVVFPDTVQHVYRAEPDGWSVPVGESISGSIYLRSMDRDCEARVTVYNEMTGAVGTTGPWVPVTGRPDGAGWVRLGETDAVEGQTSTGFQVRVQTRQVDGGAQILADDRFDVTGVQMEQTDEVLPYFDGGTVNTGLTTYVWDGEENDSTSTQMQAELDVSLLTGSPPRPVQVLLKDLAPGQQYQVLGATPYGRQWDIPGGVGTSDGSQVRMIDNRAPVNTDVEYLLISGQETLTSDTLVVPWAAPGALDYVLIQSLDGRTIVPVRKWNDNGLPTQSVIRSTAFDIRHRARPVVVLVGAGDGATSVQVVLDHPAHRALSQILREAGGAVCVRTDGNLRDMPPSDLAVITSQSSMLYAGDGGGGKARLWDMDLTWIDDPEPGTVPTVYTVDFVDTVLSGMTVAEVDAMFSELSVDDVDATDWGSVS